MTKEINEGYTIIVSETYNLRDGGMTEDRIVLGKLTTDKIIQYVTWECTRRAGVINNNYYWGHYFSEYAAALTDYHKRLIKKYENMEVLG